MLFSLVSVSLFHWRNAVVKSSWSAVRCVLIALILVAAGLSLRIASAQTGTTSLHGTVVDRSGATVVAAKVTLMNAAQAWQRQAVTGNAGVYEFAAIPPGTYVLTVESSGFRRYEQKNLQLLVDSPGTADVTLDIGSTSETVEVSAQAAAINTSDASLGVAFGENQIKQLPIEARNVPDLLSLQAGVAYTGNRADINKNVDTRSGAVNGAHSDQSNLTLDGVDVNDETRGYAFTSVLPVTPDSIQEFRVTTSNYNADEGRSSGAQVSLVTKSGSNQFHGSAYEYLRNTYTSANDYFVKLAELQNGQPNQPLKLIRNIFGGSVGGPFWKDRLYFFTNFEAYRQREQNSVIRIVPSDAMRDGVIFYQCDQPAQCPGGGTVAGLTGTHPVPAGFFGLSPAQLTSMDPQHIGSNAVVVNYLQSFPHANDLTQGDGYNYVGYRFRGPVATNNNWYIARLDYKITSNGNHTIFWRGALRNDTQGGVPYLPGQAPETSVADYSKGFTVGYTGVLGSSLVNNFRWGYTRQSVGTNGNSDQPFIQFRGLNDNNSPNNSTLAYVRSVVFQVPVHNFVDDVSWVKGKHTLQFGTNVAFIRNPSNSSLSSFSDGDTNASWLPAAGIANTGGDLDPAIVPGLPVVASSFNNSYDYPLMTLIGSITQVDAQYNYKRDGSTLPQGAPLPRRFAVNSYEFYAQDSWKIRSNLTLTYGLRYSLFSPPWETNGLQVAPTMSLGTWFTQRGLNQSQGIGAWADPTVSFDLAGPSNGGKGGFYNWDYKDFGPRVGIAYSPSFSNGLLGNVFGGPGKSSIRAGFGIVYDRVGQGLLATFNRRGSFGMSTTLTSGNGLETIATAPRVTGLTGFSSIPQTDVNGQVVFAPAPAGTFPQTFPNQNQGGGYAATFGLDSSIKTPYSYTIDFSFGRELPHGFSLEASYVGRLSHRLLSQADLAQPLDLVDPKSHIDYYTAVQALAKVYRTGVPTQSITPAMIGPTSVYWTDILQALQPGGAYRIKRCTGGVVTGTTDPLQAAYDLFCGFNANETTAIQILDQGGIPDFNLKDGQGNPAAFYHGNCGQDPNATIQNCFVNPQYASLYAWRSVGTAAYNALQINLRKRMTHGVQFDLNYTFSKSIDLESDAERVDLLGAGSLGLVINAWRPKQLRAVSDFDTPHQLNANWVAELPFGKGKYIGHDAHGVSQALIGGWQFSGVARWTSGFPVSVTNGASWATNWNFGGNAIRTAPVSTHLTKDPKTGSVSLFSNAAALITAGDFIKNLPGDSGIRNSLRGDGFAGLDLGLSKRWVMPWKESHALQFRWEVFNVLNLTRFDVQSVTANIDSGAFGNYSGLLTNPRVMQFALRYEF
jgi:hypothetical protein